MLRLQLRLLTFLLVLLVVENLVSAFTTTRLDIYTSTRPLSSTPLLFATKKKKKKKKNGRTPGGAGFGSSIPKKKAEAVTSPPQSTTSMTTKLRKERRQKWMEDEEEMAVPTTSAATARKARRQKWMEDNDEEEMAVHVPTTTTRTATARKANRQKWSDREAENRYTREYHQQLELSKNPKPQQLIQLSQDPLLFVIDDFIDPAACQRVQSNGEGCFSLMFPELIADLLFQGQENELDGLLFNAANSQQHTTKPVYPDGLHMDTNGQCLFRHVTCILYLNTIPEECGGATVFPLARALPNDPALLASQRLLDENISHTNSRAVQEAGLTAEANLLESRIGTNYAANTGDQTAIKIQPKAGRLLIFFSRTATGHQDPRAWHSGERIVSSRSSARITEKRILTLFKEVAYTDKPGEANPGVAQTTFEGYLAPLIQQQQQWLQRKANEGSPLVGYY
ncbi:expressed unknown protein [Seminavis robusta]|uniref:Prolyl 4-hydroxylase alpha subunit domain-containing protein n=1 Tax=Seminavis robusta TaxID=568900 RepID=A0A9N8DWV5_9STRA|nr:expressed unknown protein [Seminavis robusta]|eukprot:Sro427_g140740.1 n/a (453) ;mRNA; f:63085-64443